MLPQGPNAPDSTRDPVRFLWDAIALSTLTVGAMTTPPAFRWVLLFLGGLYFGYRLSQLARTGPSAPPESILRDLAMDASRVGVFFIDLENDRFWADATFESLTGMPPGFTPNRHAFLRRLAPHDRQRVEDAITDAVHETGRLDTEIRVPTELSSRVIALRGATRTVDGIRALVGSANDITDQRLMEEALAHRTLELEQINEQLDAFAHVASHDLKEPVRKIVAFGESLKEDLQETASPHAREDLHYIIDAGHRLQHLIDDLLELSHLGREPLIPQEVSVESCVDEALFSLSSFISDRGVEITRDALPEVSGNPTWITQTFQNLIANAIKFNDRPSPRVHIGARWESGIPVYSVCDDGIGIPEEEHDSIFEPFRRLHGRDVYQGTGIGLAICRTAVERHRGRLWIVSEPGTGTDFHFTLSQTEEDATTIQTEAPYFASAAVQPVETSSLETQP